MNTQKILGALLENMNDEKSYRTYHKDNNGCLTTSFYGSVSIHKICKDRDYETPQVEQLTGWPTYAVIWVGNFGIGLDFLPVELK